MTKIHDSHTCIQLNPENDHVSHLCHSKTCVNIQENKNDIVGNKTLHCGKLMDMFKKFYKEHGQNMLLSPMSEGGAHVKNGPK
jgi:hypothetical protein